MADGVVLNAGAGGATATTDDCGVAGHTQVIKLAISADGDATLIPADAAQGLDVDVTRSVLPTGAATSAKQDTIIGHVDGIEALLTTIDADTSNLSVVGGGLEATAVRVTLASDSTGVLSVDDNGGSITVDNAGLTSLNGAIAGTEVQVDVVASLPAGTNAIGKLAANSGVDIGDVDVTSIAAGTNYLGKILPTDRDITLHTVYAKKYYTSAGAVTDGIIWSPAAGTRWHVVSLFINVSAAATVTLEDDLVAGDSAVLKMELAANSGTVINFSEQYPLASGEDAADLIITTSAGNVYVTVTGYEI